MLTAGERKKMIFFPLVLVIGLFILYIFKLILTIWNLSFGLVHEAPADVGFGEGQTHIALPHMQRGCFHVSNL